MIDERPLYIAHSLRHNLEGMELWEDKWVEDGESKDLLVFDILAIHTTLRRRPYS